MNLGFEKMVSDKSFEREILSCGAVGTFACTTFGRKWFHTKVFRETFFDVVQLGLLSAPPLAEGVAV